jgi:hypothetical protein
VLLLTTHFLNLEVIKEVAAPAAAHRARCHDWQVAVRVVTYRRVEWAIDSFALYKIPGVDGIFTALLQEGWGVLSLIWSGCFVPAWPLATFKPYGIRLR